jgi:hypothetical protein
MDDAKRLRRIFHWPKKKTTERIASKSFLNKFLQETFLKYRDWEIRRKKTDPSLQIERTGTQKSIAQELRQVRFDKIC